MALLGEVDVVAETAFTCSLEQAQQHRPFRSPCLASDDDDDAAMALRLSQLEEVVAGAGRQKTIPHAHVSQWPRIRGEGRFRASAAVSSRATPAYSSLRCARQTALMRPTTSSNRGLTIVGTVGRDTGSEMESKVQAAR